jgi:hypothetical protein
MNRWILNVLNTLPWGAVVAIKGFDQIKLDALQEPDQLETGFEFCSLLVALVV